MTPTRHVLHVADPRRRNTQQQPQNDATIRATETQHTGLKALARSVLSGNTARNNSAKQRKKITQQGAVSEPSTVARHEVLESFVKLVRSEAACRHGCLLHMSTIERELDADAIADLMQGSREERQAWAAAIARRLSRTDTGCSDNPPW